MSNMFLNVVSTFKGDGLSAATKQLGAFGSAAGGLGSTLGKVGAALATFGLATKAVQFTQNSIDSARDLERNLFSVKTVFDEFAPAIEKFTLNAEGMGLAQKDAAKASVFLGSVLKQSGFSMEFVSSETQKLVELGVDLAATYGYDVQEALLGMTALFRGEYDPIEKFGVAMKQSEINSELAARGLDKLEGAARRNAEQTIRLELLYQRAADASGAFRAQSGNLYVEQKKLQAAFENMQATVGTQLLPAIGGLVAELKPLVDVITPRLIQVVNDAGPGIQTMTQFIKDLGDKSTTTGATVSFIADTLGTFFRILSENFGVIVQAAILVGGLRVAFILLTAAMNTTPIGWAITGLGLLAGAFLLVNDAAKGAEDSVYKLNVEMMKTDPVNQAIAPYRVYEGLLGDLSNSTAVMSEETRKMIADVERADKAKLDNLKQQFINTKISAGEAANEIRRMTQQAGIAAGGAPDAAAGAGAAASSTGGGGAKKKPAPSGLGALVADAKKSTAVVKKQGALQRAGLSKTVAAWITSTGKPIKAANQALKLIGKNGSKGVKKLNSLYKKSSAGRAAAERAAESASAEAAQAAAERARKEAERIAEQKRVYQSFLDSVSNTFAGIKNSIMSAFDITDLGSSTNSIIRNLNKLLTKTRSFAANIAQLSTMGLDPALLQQVISAGPMAGARLAAALVQGGVGALGQINAAYGEFGNLATSIATTGTNALFGTQAQQNVYNINVSGGVGSGATIGQAIVQAIKDYERVSGAVWQGA
jgi:uncharacterized protein YidB (DUF937 family)